MIRFEVPDMTCTGCIGSMTRAVQAVDPAARLAADLQSRSVEIQSVATAAALATAIAAAGFTIRPQGRPEA